MGVRAYVHAVVCGGWWGEVDESRLPLPAASCCSHSQFYLVQSHPSRELQGPFVRGVCSGEEVSLVWKHRAKRVTAALRT
jgi:hypothetical protein